MALLGLIGGPLAVLGGILLPFGAFDNGSAPLSLITVPEILCEASLTIGAPRATRFSRNERDYPRRLPAVAARAAKRL
jgi:hypothetical protein